MKYLLALLLFAFSGFAAEPPAVKSKAAQKLLKHPEFKKAMEAAPEFTKAVLAELDKHAPKPVKVDNFWGFKKNTPKRIVLADPKDWAREARRRLEAVAADGKCPTKKEIIKLLGKPDSTLFHGWFWDAKFIDEVGIDRYNSIAILYPGEKGWLIYLPKASNVKPIP